MRAAVVTAVNGPWEVQNVPEPMGSEAPYYMAFSIRFFGDPDQIVAISRHDRLGWYFKQQANIIFGGHGANVSAMAQDRDHIHAKLSSRAGP